MYRVSRIPTKLHTEALPLLEKVNQKAELHFLQASVDVYFLQ